LVLEYGSMRSVNRSLIWFALLVKCACGETNLPDLAPSVTGLFPLGGRVGETIQLRIDGRNLDGAKSITFPRADIQAQILKSEFFSLQAKVVIGANVATGLHDFRLQTPRGSAVGVFYAGSLPEAREQEPNNDLAHAEKITLPTIVNGTAEAGDYDLFRF